MDKNISFTLKVWRQRGPKEKGHFQTIPVKDMPGDTSFLEMLDIVNEELINKGVQVAKSSTLWMSEKIMSPKVNQTDIYTIAMNI